MNFICFILQNARHDRQKQLLEDKVKALENELERARNRLQSLRAQAEERVRKKTERKQIGATVGCWFLGGRKSGIPTTNLTHHTLRRGWKSNPGYVGCANPVCQFLGHQ